MSDLAARVGKTIRFYREVKGISQEKFAAEANISRAHLGRIERGEHNINLVSIEKICTLLNVSLPDFFQTVETGRISKSDSVIAQVNSILGSQDYNNQLVIKKMITLLLEFKNNSHS